MTSQDNEAFLHRSGRTGRAGKEGTAVVMYGDRDARALGQLFRETKVRTGAAVQWGPRYACCVLVGVKW